MYSPQIQRTSYFSNFESPKSCLQSKWFVVALAISSLVFLGAAVFGGTGLFASNLPQWLTHAVGTIGHSGCLAMLMWGSVFGGACAITAIILMVKRTSNLSTISPESIQTPHREPIRETEVIPPNEESIETLNARLIDAARDGQIGEVIALLDRGANIESRSENGRTPLMIAARAGRVNVVATLLDRRANIEATTQSGSTPLMIAAVNDHVDVVRTLLDRGANFDTTDTAGLNALIYANGHLTHRLLLNHLRSIHSDNCHIT